MKEFDYSFRNSSGKKTILVAPLNWGLGHAARCIPIITALLSSGFDVVLASDGEALNFLRKEFPKLKSVDLPAYDVRYAKKARGFNFKLFLKLPHIRRAVLSEKRITKKLVSNGEIDGIISDNRLGVRDRRLPSVFITHQLKVLSGKTTFVSSKLHQLFIQKFDECWVPDVADLPNLSGKLGHLKKNKFPVKYIGPLSRMKKKPVARKYDLFALLSGPEPQRSLLAEQLIKMLMKSELKALVVKGRVEGFQKREKFGNIEIVNFMQTEELEKSINESELILSRSGYTTIMDLMAMGKKAYFIPTPGQSEQLYLAQRLKNLGLVPYCQQENFTLEKLHEISEYGGLKSIEYHQDLSIFFRLFERK